MTNDIVQGAHLGDLRLFLCFESADGPLRDFTRMSEFELGSKQFPCCSAVMRINSSDRPI
jgi:hypothetical protein